MWFTWTRERLVISAFAGARKLDALAIGAAVALSIDTEDFPYRSLTVRGVVSDVRAFEGLTPDYVAAAARYLGPSLGQTWCDALQGRAIQTRIAVRPTNAVVADLARDSSFFSRPK